MPGGFNDYGEEPADAARREVMEETGLDVERFQQRRLVVFQMFQEIQFAVRFGERFLVGLHLRDLARCHQHA